MSTLTAVQLDNVFDALAHRKRRGMLHKLSLGPATVSQLAKENKLSLPLIYKHLRVMERAQLIHRRKAGRTNFVALNKKSLRLAQGWLNQYHTEWGNERETLGNYIAGLRE